MVLQENWGVSVSHAEAFFAAQPDVEQTADGFRFGSCRITLQAGTNQVGPWTQVRTVLSLEGEEDDVRRIYRRFFLRFLSAGG